ncbi:PhoH family protein [bacterium]|nr:PhoH family protein [bacterium]
MENLEFDKIFVIDTNVLLHDPQSIFKFQDNLVVIPIVVLEEIDTFKKGHTENSRNSRQFSRYLDVLRVTGDISKGVKLSNGGYLKIDLDKKTELTADNRILETAVVEKNNNTGKQVTVISKDINLRIKANALGVESQDYNSDKVKFEDSYTGVLVHDCDGEFIDSLYQNSVIPIKNTDLEGMYPNQYVVFKNTIIKQKGIGRYDAKTESIVPLIGCGRDDVFGIRHKNMEQSIALDLLLNDDLKLVSLVGKAGTGKTLLAVACGLKKTIEEERYKKLLISRPIVPLGKDLGYLPGDVNEKLSPWMKPIFDNIEYLLGGTKDGRVGAYKELMDNKFVEVEPLTYIRGRSLPDQFMIIDESQNLSPHEIKTIVSRAGENTKIVLTGDCEQIDNPYVDAESNGLARVVESFKDQPIAGHVTLLKGERSELADIASNVL